MKNYKYTLEPYDGIKSRYHCPACKRKEKKFSRYINTQTLEHIHETVGKCNRESNCGYHYTPKQYFQDNKIFLIIIIRKFECCNSVIKDDTRSPRDGSLDFGTEGVRKIFSYSSFIMHKRIAFKSSLSTSFFNAVI